MKDQLKHYIDTIFSDAERRSPGHVRLAELKEEMLHNLYEKYDDLIAAGRSPSAAYHSLVAGVGDISELLDSFGGDADGRETGKEMPAEPAKPMQARRPLTPEEEAVWRRYKNRAAILSAVSVALYILCWVPLVILDALFSTYGDELGLVALGVMVAVATALQVYNSKSKPRFGKDVTPERPEDEREEDDREEDEREEDEREGADRSRPRRSPVYAAISGALWVLTVCAYILVSFATGYWHITWIMFLIATALDNMIKAIFDLRR